MAGLLKRLRTDRRGATAIEYGLIAAIMVVACITSFKALADSNKGLWAIVSTKTTAAMS